jgi:hypothetical protein
MKILVCMVLVIADATCPLALMQQSQSLNSPASVSLGFGKIKGHVFGADGKPLANAEVYAEILDGRPFVGQRPWARTDQEGKFSIEPVKPGLHKICAHKEEDGYPDPFSSFYPDAAADFPEVNVRDGQITDGVIVRLGHRYEKLLVSAVDTENRSVIKHATLRMSLISNPIISKGLAADATGHFTILVPSAPASIKISATGYADAGNLNARALLDSARNQNASKRLRAVDANRVHETTIVLRRTQ